LLSLLAKGEPRGLPGAIIQTVRFQQAAFGRPFDDVAIDAINADGSPAYLDIQSKRSPDFTKSDTEFGKVVQALWATSRSLLWANHRYEAAVAIARTSTRIERDYQQVLDWARRVGDGATFGEHIRRAGFASTGMRDFADAFRFHLEGAGAPTDDETVWQLLRRFQILVFDFEAPGSDWQHRAHERARVVLSPEQASAAQNLWAVLCQIALEYDAAGGSLDRDALIRQLAEKHGFAFAQRSDLRQTFKRLSESTRDALASVSDQIGGVSLSRSNLINAAENALDCSKFLQIVGGSGLGKSGLMKRLASRLETEGVVLFLSPPRIVGGGWMRMASDLDCPIDRTELFIELACGGAASVGTEYGARL
jgi:hypothetical protein